MLGRMTTLASGRTTAWLSVALALLRLGTAAHAGEILYDAEKRVLHVLDYSRETPCTPSDLLQAERRAGWGVVRAEPGSGTVTLDAGLAIGSDDGSESFFHLAPDRQSPPRLIVRGTLHVREAQRERYQIYQAHNGFMVGDPSDPGVQPFLLFEQGAAGKSGLVVDGGNVLDMVHARVQAVQRREQDRFRMDVDPRITSGRLRLEHCVFSWFTRITLPSLHGIVRHVTFEYGDELAGSQYLEDCVFRNMQVGLRDHGALLAVLVRCRFERNHMHWMLPYSRWGIIADDCTFGPEEKTPQVGVYRHPRSGIVQRPSFIARRHITILVQDPEGRPVPGATVRVVCEQGDASAVIWGMAITDDQGCTPPVTAKHALFVTDKRVRRGAGAEAPLVTTAYTYKVGVSAPGRGTVEKHGVDPDDSWYTLRMIAAPHTD